jgi:hypothetical protein
MCPGFKPSNTWPSNTWPGSPSLRQAPSSVEYAARAGTTTTYSWGDDIGKGNANCNGCGSQRDNKQTAPVGSFRPNGFGLYDMRGNYLNGPRDASHNNYKGAPTDRSPSAGHPCRGRVPRRTPAERSVNGARRRSAVVQVALRPQAAIMQGAWARAGWRLDDQREPIGQVDRSRDSSRAAQALFVPTRAPCIEVATSNRSGFRSNAPPTMSSADFSAAITSLATRSVR